MTLSYYANRQVFPATLMRLQTRLQDARMPQEPNLNSCGACEVPCVKRICGPSEMW